MDREVASVFSKKECLHEGGIIRWLTPSVCLGVSANMAAPRLYVGVSAPATSAYHEGVQRYCQPENSGTNSFGLDRFRNEQGILGNNHLFKISRDVAKRMVGAGVRCGHFHRDSVLAFNANEGAVPSVYNVWRLSEEWFTEN